MEYKRLLDLFAVRAQFEQKLIADGLPEEKAKQGAGAMSVGDIQQTQKDLARHPKIKVIDKRTGTEREILQGSFNTTDETEDFLRSLSQDNEQVYDYLSKYLHQGGFLHLSELLMAYYFAPDANFITNNRVATFTIEEDGSLTYEEKFDIEKIRTPEMEYQTLSGSSIASISLISKIKPKENDVEHSYENITVNAHDKAATKFFEDNRNKFSKFLTWIKESLQSLFSKAKREHLHQVKEITSPRAKL